nr:hypothetical protein [Tanacetum cinerariifolium]
TSHPTTSSIPLPSLPTALIPPVTQPDPTPIRQYTKRARIGQSSALPTIADELASPVRDVREAAAKRISNDSEEIARVLTSMDAATVLAGGIDVPTSSGSIPTTCPLLLSFPLAVKLVPLLVQLLQEEREKKLWWSMTFQRRRNYKNRLMPKLPEN